MADERQAGVRVRIAGVVISVTSGVSDQCFSFPGREKPFLSDSPPEVIVHAHYGPLPEFELGDRLFESNGVWSLYRGRDHYVVVLRAPGPKAPPYGLATFAPDLQAADVYLRDVTLDDGTYPYPLAHPLDELLMVNLLARGRGVLLHAFGIRDGDGGTLFAGVSGAGKSTLATLWEGQEGVILLSDDRVVVRRHEGRYWLYGTPWCGDARAASPQGVPLERIFVIRHAGKNRAVPLTPLDAASRLLVRSFPTFWDADGMAFTLAFLGDLAQAVPCYELGFVPDGSVVEYVQRITSKNSRSR